MSKALPEFLTLKEAAARCGRCYRTIWNWVHAGYLPIVRPPIKGRRRRGSRNLNFIVLGTDVDKYDAMARGLEPRPKSEGKRTPDRPYLHTGHQQRRLANMTPEQLEARREYNREYARRRREWGF